MTKFKVGDKVRMLNKERVLAAYCTSNGEVYDVISVNLIGSIEIDDKSGGYPLTICVREFNAIELVTNPSKSDRISALETEVATLKAQVDALEKAKTTTVHNVTVSVESAKSIDDITKFFDTTAVKFPYTARFNRESAAETKTPNERRADVIKRAKAFVVKYDGIVRGDTTPLTQKTGDVRIQFVVNVEKRTVVAIPRLAHVIGVVNYAKGIAKCDPSDVFNADIGKAIALGRALGVDVTEFEQAVQPTEVVVGLRIQSRAHPECKYAITSVVDGKAFVDNLSYFYFTEDLWQANVTFEDTDADYVGTRLE